MRIDTSAAKKPPMDAEAYAGFLKLLLTPSSKAPEISPELGAYLAYLNEHDPLPADVCRPLTDPTSKQAA